MALLKPGDIIIDGGNSNWKDTVRRSVTVTAAGMHYHGLRHERRHLGPERGLQPDDRRRAGDFPVLRADLQDAGAARTATATWALHGAGHFVKMVHNGVEYGMLQAYGEGFEIIEKSQFKPDLREVTRVWQNGSVVRSWLLDLAALAFADDPTLSQIRGYVEDSGEGRWTVQAAIDEDVPAPVITLSLLQRFVSRQPDSFSRESDRCPAQSVRRPCRHL